MKRSSKNAAEVVAKQITFCGVDNKYEACSLSGSKSLHYAKARSFLNCPESKGLVWGWLLLFVEDSGKFQGIYIVRTTSPNMHQFPWVAGEAGNCLEWKPRAGEGTAAQWFESALNAGTEVRSSVPAPCS
uniref:Uncharacterized protein n=1 Tax=Sphaerodactylus townsendi TaxID=933632 RepID=A0ACB8FDX2_9SAUR